MELCPRMGNTKKGLEELVWHKEKINTVITKSPGPAIEAFDSRLDLPPLNFFQCNYIIIPTFQHVTLKSWEEPGDEAGLGL